MVSAPGKVVLLGDYAVLDGGVAMVAAVGRRAEGAIVPRSTSPEGVVKAVLDRVPHPAFDLARESIEIDTTSFHDERGQKLGIGSSAAVATVAAALTLGRGGPDALSLATDAHRLATGGGSGVDVAASFYGGIIAAPRQPARVRSLPLALSGLHPFTLFAGKSASTARMVEACLASPRWPTHARELSRLSDEGIEAWSRQDASSFLAVVAGYGEAMDALGRDAGVEVVTQPIRSVMRLARDSGAAAKPSGAGGGDVIIGFSFDPDLGRRLAAQTGLLFVDLEIDPVGLRL